MAAAWGLLLLVYVVVSVVVVSAAQELELCNESSAATIHGPKQGVVEWNWVPPYPECVWRSEGTERREAVVFDPITGSLALLLLVVALGGFVGWLVLMVRDAEQIAEEKSSE